MSIEDFRSKQIWTKYFRDENGTATHLIELSNHKTQPMPEMDRGENNWCLYAYIYPEHPMFKLFNFPSHDYYSKEASFIEDMPLHGGVTYLEYYWTDSEMLGAPSYGQKALEQPLKTSVKVGCDYSHAWDEIYSTMETPSNGLINDAEGLGNYLTTK